MWTEPNQQLRLPLFSYDRDSDAPEGAAYHLFQSAPNLNRNKFSYQLPVYNVRHRRKTLAPTNHRRCGHFAARDRNPAVVRSRFATQHCGAPACRQRAKPPAGCRNKIMRAGSSAYVACVSRGAAVTQLQPLKLLGKILQHTRHRKGRYGTGQNGRNAP
jgi:hypothetical protein